MRFCMEGVEEIRYVFLKGVEGGRYVFLWRGLREEGTFLYGEVEGGRYVLYGGG